MHVYDISMLISSSLPVTCQIFLSKRLSELQLLKEVVRIFKYSEALKVAADAASQSRQVNFRM